MPKHKHISRVKTGNTDGWQVRLRRQGQSHSKFFSLKKHGDEEAALAAAIQYRDALLEIAPPPAPSAAVVNKSADVGVRYYKQGDSWQAQWVGGDGKRKKRHFSVKKHGALRAKQLAQMARMRGIARLDQI